MANTTSNKSTTTAKATTKKEAAPTTPIVDTEKEQLKAQLAEQQKRMEEMMAQMQVLMQAQSTAVTPTKPINSNKQIVFINMTAGGLNLKGTRMYHIDNQFGTRSVQESEARVIVANMPNTIANGYVYIPDNEFLESCNMGGVYDGMLNDEQMKTLLNQDANYVCDVFENATDSQKRIIIDMVSDRQLNGKPVDANILVRLGKLAGVDFLDIEPLDDKE
uniref:Uncharacterized protein n=1 Tax=Siphoviridae sp. ctKcB20 TaxID=2827568 RepID=A0A8S5LKZ0_9CAUD|nr:MAG TPA: hypothetical protein [Siphoviridae sp. ctKcB20]